VLRGRPGESQPTVVATGRSLAQLTPPIAVDDECLYWAANAGPDAANQVASLMAILR
jgi:hypothetical protein